MYKSSIILLQLLLLCLAKRYIIKSNFIRNY